MTIANSRVTFILYFEMPSAVEILLKVGPFYQLDQWSFHFSKLKLIWKRLGSSIVELTPTDIYLKQHFQTSNILTVIYGPFQSQSCAKKYRKFRF